MKITVILCTYNRCRGLAATLNSLAAQASPGLAEWELLVVDNSSTDGTSKVVEDFCRRQPRRFSYVFEPQPGKSHALNRGIREASGDILAFLDDDVIAQPTWLQNLAAPFGEEQCAGVGGRVLPLGTFSPPRWLAVNGPYNLGHVLYAQFDLGSEPCELKRPPFGANMAFRKRMFEEYGLFRTDLGPSPHPEIPSPLEDVEFGSRLLTARERLRYQPSAIVYHTVSEHRMQKRYFLERSFDLGRASVRISGPGPSVLGIPRLYLNILKLATAVMAQKMALWIVALNQQRRFHYRCSIWTTAGRIREYLRLARSAPPRDCRP